MPDVFDSDASDGKLVVDEMVTRAGGFVDAFEVVSPFSFFVAFSFLVISGEPREFATENGISHYIRASAIKLSMHRAPSNHTHRAAMRLTLQWLLTRRHRRS